MFETYFAQKLMVSLKWREDENFMERAPLLYCGAQVSWICRTLSHLGDVLIQAGLTLKRRYRVEQPVISVY